MDIQNTDYKEIAKLMYPHFLQSQIKRRDAAIEMFNNNDFKGMNNAYPYVKKEQCEIILKSVKMSDVIKELQNFKLPDHSTEPEIHAECQCDYEIRFYDDDPKIKISYYKYSIPDFDFCPGIAKHISENYAWKIKHQPNGKDAKQGLKILNKFL